MANPEHLEILKQGVEVWNRWREEHPAEVPLLENADLREMNLAGANLHWAILAKANLEGANLSKTILVEAVLDEAILHRTDLTDANLREARMRNTIFGDIDFSVINGLDSVVHFGPSIISIDSLYRSKGKIPEVFLRGVGVPDTFISYIPALTDRPIQFYSCFISHSSKDDAFSHRFHADLQQKGVRCWFAPEDMKIGDKIRHSIDQAIRLQDKLLLILSTRSVQSEWVGDEVEHALELEKERGELVLFPLRLDDAVLHSKIGWAAKLKRDRHIGDFCGWPDEGVYERGFKRLLNDLRTEG